MSNAVKTYEDYVALPDDGNRYEVIEGELCLVPAPNRKHQIVILNIAAEFRNFLRGRELGHVYIAPFDVVLSNINVLQPDVLYVSNHRLDILTDAGAFGAPDLAVEVLSPSTRGRDEVTKLRLYENFGVDEYWIADPEHERVRVFRRSGMKLDRVDELSRGDTVTTPLVAGFAIAVDTMFDV